MQKYLLLFAILVCYVVTGNSQNRQPVVDNLVARLDMDNRRVVMTYDLSSGSVDDVEVQVYTLAKNGKRARCNSSAMSGDVGQHIKAGRGKKILLDYASISNLSDTIQFSVVAVGDLSKELKLLANAVSDSSLTKYLKRVYGVRSFKTKKSRIHLENVKTYIDSCFRGNKLKTDWQEGMHGDYKFRNIIGRHSGKANERTFILCAHFDTDKTSPGADDNASGVAGMLEAMRILSAYSFRHSIVFIAFDIEEEGHIGSKHFVQKLDLDSTENVEGVFNYDMIGYYSDEPGSQRIPEGFDYIYPEIYKTVSQDGYRGNFILTTSNMVSDTLNQIFSASAREFVPSLKVVSIVADGNGQFVPSLAASDHAQFWNSGYRAIHIGDAGDTRNIYLDSKRDTFDKVNFQFMRDVVRATVVAIAKVAELQHSGSASVKMYVTGL